MVTTISEVENLMKEVLGTISETRAKKRGFVKRRSKLGGSTFAQTLVLGWLHNPGASLESLSQMAASMGVEITPQGLDQRFNTEAAAYLKDVLEASLTRLVSSEPVAIPVLERFSAVVVQDSSVIQLPDELEGIWQGFGGSNGKNASSLKLHVKMELRKGELEGPRLSDGRCHDQTEGLKELPQGALLLSDLGYFNLGVYEKLDSLGAYFLSRFKVGTKLFKEDGEVVELSQIPEDSLEVDMPVLLGATHRLSVRLLGVRVPEQVSSERRRKLKEWSRKKMSQPSKARLALCDWTLLITNVPVLSVEEALVLARTRWQIEQLFKLWKQHGQIDEWRSGKPFRILCELYAKLVAMVIQHWMMLVSCWSYPDKSLVKASQTIRSYAPMLACAIAGLLEVSMVLQQIASCIASGCRMNSRRKRPNNYQLLLSLGCQREALS